MRVIEMAGVPAAPGRPPLGKDASEVKNAFGGFLDRDEGSGKAGRSAMRDMADETVLRSAHTAGEKVEELFPTAASTRLTPERSEAGRDVSSADTGPVPGSDAADHDMRFQPAGRARIDWLALRMPKGEDAPAAKSAEPTVENVDFAPPAEDASLNAPQKMAGTLPDARLAASGLRRDERVPEDRQRPSIRAGASRSNAADAPARLSTPVNFTETATPTPRDAAAREVARSATASLALRQPFASASGEQAPDTSARPVATLSVQTVPAFAAGLQGPSQTVLGTIREEVPELARPAASTIAGQPSTAEPMRILKIQLHPLELGVVTARLSLQGGEMSVELQTETREAASKLAMDSNEIAKALRGLGIEIDRVTVTQSTSNQTQSQGQQNQQSAFERSGERFGSESGESDRQNGQRGANNGAGGFEGERNAGVSQSSRGVYI